MHPIKIAAQGSTASQLAVIETQPARSPLVSALKSSLYSLFYPVMCFLVKNVNSPQALGDSTVFVIASAADFHPPSVRASEEPPLNINHPTQRIRVPSVTLETL
jgi:hypothetical protein